MGNTTQKLGCLSVEEEQQEEEDGSTSFTCGICMETMSKEKKFKSKKCCSHPFCSDCISKHIYYKVHDTRMAQVECPHPGCAKPLDHLSCRSILAVNTFVRWCDVIVQMKVMESPHAYCPYRDCSELVVDECCRRKASNAKKAKCPKCKRLFCFQCKVPWHAGYRCAEGRVRRNRDDVIFGQLAEKKGWQRCPNCNTCVERTRGCQAIVCRCNYVFCYSCGSKYSLRHVFSCPSQQNRRK